MASSKGNGKFTEFVCLHGANSISQKSTKFYLLTHYFTYSPKYFCQFIVLPICQSFPLYGTQNLKFLTLQHFVCLTAFRLAYQPAVRPVSTIARAPVLSHNKGNHIRFTKLLFQRKFIYCTMVLPFILY